MGLFGKISGNSHAYGQLKGQDSLNGEENTGRLQGKKEIGEPSGKRSTLQTIKKFFAGLSVKKASLDKSTREKRGRDINGEWRISAQSELGDDKLNLDDENDSDLSTSSGKKIIFSIRKSQSLHSEPSESSFKNTLRDIPSPSKPQAKTLQGNMTKNFFGFAEFKKSPLEFKNNCDMIKRAIHYGVDPNLQDEHGHTMLYILRWHIVDLKEQQIDQYKNIHNKTPNEIVDEISRLEEKIQILDNICEALYHHGAINSLPSRDKSTAKKQEDKIIEQNKMLDEIRDQIILT